MEWNRVVKDIISRLSASDVYSCITHNGLSYGSLLVALDKLKDFWEVRDIGRSFEGRSIYSVQSGNTTGQRVLLWSQMHGNEPASTFALLMLLEYLSEENNPFVREILSSTYLAAIPMLNPDGAVRGLRRNAQGIDINRDARRRTSPEARLLIEVFEDFRPQFCFNLHDQEIYYAPAASDRPTMMAFLAPSADSSKSITPARVRAMDILGFVISCLEEYTLARYNDEFMPNAFGDYFSSRGAVTMLFETGYIVGDDRRLQTSLLHTVSLILALVKIAGLDKENSFVEVYNTLSFNVKNAFFDFIMRNVILSSEKGEFMTDIAINRDRLDPDSFVLLDSPYYVYDIGDLQDKKAFQKKDFNGKLVLPSEKIFMYAPANWLLKYFETF